VVVSLKNVYEGAAGVPGIFLSGLDKITGFANVTFALVMVNADEPPAVRLRFPSADKNIPLLGSDVNVYDGVAAKPSIVLTVEVKVFVTLINSGLLI
jgi:hypothetical protein